MFRITVKVNNFQNNWNSHAEAKIEDLKTNEVTLVSFGNASLAKYALTTTTDDKRYAVFTKNKEYISNFFDGVEESCGAAQRCFSVELYTNRETSLTEFDKALKENFSDFSLYCKNCSDAVNFVLNYFFPKNLLAETAWQGMKLTTFPLCLATCGTLPSLAPPGVVGPIDILLKAQLLKHKYGKASLSLETSLLAERHPTSDLESFAPKHQSMSMNSD